MIVRKFALTTEDNPYNPFTQFEQWYAEDLRLGYNSLGLLARVAITSDELSIADQEFAYDQAVNEIVNENVLGVFTLVMAPKEVNKVEIR